MKNNVYKEFLVENDFKEIEKKYREEYSKEFQLNKNSLLFSDFNKNIHQKYLENKIEITESYFKNLENDFLNKSVEISDYYPIFLLEDGFDESQSKFFATYFLQFIKNLNIAISNEYYNNEILDFTWNIFDRIFHECFHCEQEFEEEYFKELTKLKKQIMKIDKQDEHLIKQKIEQFIS
ncbi:hypothetical protein [Empedobacter brevis]|uniref:hypothetical protein n=1 Tax=Empedobacter brevis TaxID=247 RepID=UPI0023EFF73A|nr:hypothetical protein [Empedobacter brevis]